MSGQNYIFRKLKFPFFMLLIVNLFLLTLSEARNLQYKQYNVIDGLRQSQVVRITQLPETHQMIFATVSGLSYYDGVKFTNPEDSAHSVFAYCLAIVDSELWVGTRSEGIVVLKNKRIVRHLTTENGLPGNWVNDIVQKNGKIYIATNRGLVIFSPRDTLYYDGSNGLLHDVVLDLYVDDEGDVWYTSFWGFGLITAAGKILNVDGRNKFKNPFCEDIHVDFYGHVWVATRKGLLIFDKNELMVREKLVSPFWLYSPELSEDFITVIAEDQFHDIWIGTKHGLIKYEYSSAREEMKGQIYLNQFVHFPLKNLYIKDIYRDVENNIWIGTRGGGAFKIQGDIFWSYGLEDGLLNQEILAIHEDQEGRIWVGTNNGCALFQEEKFINFTTKDGVPYNVVTCFYTDWNGQLWAGTWKGIARFTGNGFKAYPVNLVRSFEQFRVYDIVQMNDSILWLASGNGLAEFSLESGTYQLVEELPQLYNVRISEINEINDSLISMTTSKYVWIYNKRTHYLFRKNIKKLADDFYIRTVKFISPSNFVVGSNHGILYYKNDSLMIHFSRQNYLVDEDIIALALEDSNAFWIGTNKGIAYISKKAGDFIVKHYSSRNGFYGEEIITHHSLLVDSKKNGWFGTFLGLSKYIKYKDIPNTVPPVVFIEGIRIFKKETSGATELTLSYKENTISINYIGISFRDESDIVYRYRLLGFDENWSEPVADRQAVYFDLPSGTYTFEVIARNRDGVWSEVPAKITFTILAPFWETPGFIMLVMVSLIFIGYFYSRSKIKKVREERDLLEKKVVARTKTLIEQQKRLIQTNQQLQNLTNELRASMDKLKQAQLQLIQSEKMASLGTLIAGVTHELNNPITFIYSNFESLKEYITSIEKILQSIKEDVIEQNPRIKDIYEKEDIDFILEDLPQLLKGIEYGANRIKDIVAQLYRFSHPGKNRDKIDIHENLELTLNLFLNQYKRHVNIVKEFGELPIVDAPSGELNQVFLNLLVNAAYAIKSHKGQGNIWIKTWTENDHVYVSIRDDGGGIPENIQDKIFDPFFTTKPIGEGTGLGLSLCYTIIQNLNGDIQFRNVNGGAEFIVKIPIEQEDEGDES